MAKTKYDVAVFGLWWSSNYGSIMTYYSLYCLLESFGKRTVLIDRPGFPPDHPLFKTDGRRFQREHFPVTPVFAFSELEKLNEYADCFVMGSDQVWNYGISKPYHGAFFLNFVQDDKKKLSYAASFGHPGFYAPEEEIEKTRKLLERFDGISVRETGAVQIVNQTFGLKAERVLDPVFAVEPQVFVKLMKQSKAAKKGVKCPYLCTYILDPTSEKREAIQYLARMKGLPMVHMLDGYQEHFEKNKARFGMEGVVEDLKVEDWLYYIYHCDFFLTDSCHGASFAILFQKDFICIGNESRGLPRFESLAQLFHMEERFVYDAAEIPKRRELLKEIDFSESERILQKERMRSRKWLKHHLDAPIRKDKHNLYEPPKPLWKKAAVKSYQIFLKPFLSEEKKAKIRERFRR